MTEPVVLLINPNSSDEVTRIIDDVAGRHRGNGTRYVTVKVASNPPAIETVDDEILAVQGLLASVLEWRDRFDVAAAVVACFGDPGVSELRHATGWQVHGIAYEAMRSAVERGQRFSIVCALPSAVPIMEQLAAHYGWADMLVSVRPLASRSSISRQHWRTPPHAWNKSSTTACPTAPTPSASAAHP